MPEREHKREEPVYFPQDPAFDKFLEYASVWAYPAVFARGLHYIINATWLAEKYGSVNSDAENFYKGLGLGLIAIITLVLSPHLKKSLKTNFNRREFLSKATLTLAGFAAGLLINSSDGTGKISSM